MHLIEKKLAGSEIPAQLPPSLIPPSMRGQPAQRQAPQPEPVQDLFSFDDTPPSSAVAPQHTGGFATLQPQPTGPRPTISAQPTGSRLPINDPFAPAITPTYTGKFLALNKVQAHPILTTPIQEPIISLMMTNRVHRLHRLLFKTSQLKLGMPRTNWTRPHGPSMPPKLSVLHSKKVLQTKPLSCLPCRHSCRLPRLRMRLKSSFFPLSRTDTIRSRRKCRRLERS